MSGTRAGLSVRSVGAWLRALDPSFLLAAIGTVGYYSVMLQPEMHDTVLAKYTTEHAVEYAIVALFIWGCIDLVFKLLALPRELIATRHHWLPARAGREPASQAQVLLNHVRSKPAWLRNSRIGKRLQHALAYVTERGSAEDYGDHIHYLADQDFNKSQSDYTLLRFVIAVTPILGFLGTVVHFGAAIGSFSFTDMEAKLPAVVAGMGTAFNTTTVALATAMVMMFALFLCERIEYGMIASIDRMVESELVNRFEVKDINVVPFLAVVEAANQEALRAITQTQEAQLALWSESLTGLFQRFDERQDREIARWEAAFSELRQNQIAYQEDREAQLRQIVSLLNSREERHMEQIQLALQQASSFSDGVGDLVKTLNGIAAGEGRLVELQASLTDNLRVIHETHQIDGALHGLSAAIHLLTARSRQIGVHDPAA